MTKIIAISNPKGGVGKTTTVINLAASLAVAEKRVLMIDMDPSGAASTGLGLPQEQVHTGLIDVFAGRASLSEALYHLAVLNLDIIPVNVRNSEEEIRLSEMAKNRIQLKRHIHSMKSCGKLDYDFILIDTPPALNDLTIGALLAANSVLIPLQVGHFAHNAVERLFQMIERIRKGANTELGIEGVLLNFFEKGTRVSLHSAYRAKKVFGEAICNTIIPKNTAIGFAAYQEKPTILVDSASTGARAYLALAREIIHNQHVATALVSVNIARPLTTGIAI